MIGLFLIFLQETHCSVATNHFECRAISTIYGFSILIGGSILYVLSISMSHIGIITGVGLLLLPFVPHGKGRDSLREPAPVHGSRYVEARGGVRQHEETHRFVSLSEPFALFVVRSITPVLYARTNAVMFYAALRCAALRCAMSLMHEHVCSQTGENNTN